LIGYVCVSVQKMFHTPSDTDTNHAGIFIHTTKSLVDDSCRVSPVTRNSMTARRRNDMSWQPFSRSEWRERKRSTCADLAFMVEREDVANGYVMLVTIFPPNSS
jgi:hypothetical protein